MVSIFVSTCVEDSMYIMHALVHANIDARHILCLCMCRIFIVHMFVDTDGKMISVRTCVLHIKTYLLYIHSYVLIKTCSLYIHSYMYFRIYTWKNIHSTYPRTYTKKHIPCGYICIYTWKKIQCTYIRIYAQKYIHCTYIRIYTCKMFIMHTCTYVCMHIGT